MSMLAPQMSEVPVYCLMDGWDHPPKLVKSENDGLLS